MKKNKIMGLPGVLHGYKRISAGQDASVKLIIWGARTLSGIIQGLGLLALIQLAAALESGKPAGGLSTTGWIIVLLIASILGAVTIFFRDKFSYLASFEFMREVHRLVGDKLSRLPLGWFSATVTGKLSRLGAATVTSLGNMSAHMLTFFTVSLVTLLTLLVGLLSWFPTLGLVLAICLVCYMLLMWALTFLDARMQAYKEPAAVELSDRVVEFSSSQAMLRACNRMEYPQLKDAVEENRRRSARGLWGEVVGNLLGGIATQVIAVLMIATAAQQAISGALSPLEAVAVMGISLQISQYLTSIAESRAGILTVAPAMQTVMDVLDEEPLSEPKVSEAQDDAGSIALDNVDFSYLAGHQVLDKVSFTVPKHTMTALVGPSGSGKTTIARLICRFWDVDSGEVRIGGTDVRQLTTEDLMSQISMVFQDIYLFDDTLEANVRLGNPNATEGQLQEAAELAGVSEIVARLPQGWDTPVGEGGTALSGGERQRVSVARAILKQAPILLFDEATSALDAENEANMVRAFEQLRRHSTVLVIAHKLNTIAQADQIAVLDDSGQVAQLGSHQELIEQPGIYRSFWENREKAVGWQIAAK